MKDLKQIYFKALSSYSALSVREKTIIIAAAVLFSLMGVYQLIDSTRERLLTQTIRLEEANTALRSLPPLIVKYGRAKTKREEIEAKYKAVQIPEGALSLLEKLVKEKAKASPGTYTIVPRSADFSSQYKQTTYAIKFRASQISDLVNFLKEVVDGPRPLLLTRLDVTKSFAGDRLDIEADISSIEKKSAKEDA